jgi:exonuclease III
MNSKLPRLSISSINVNSMNVSTLGMSQSKTLLKVEGVTMKKTDIILLSDVRAKDKGDELGKLFKLTQNGCYNLILHSSKESRGVGVAIKRNIAYEVKRTVTDGDDENLIILDMVIKGKELVVGSVYGPNANNPEFFDNIKRKLDQLNKNFILGGDMNTILCNDNGVQNLDRIGPGRTPNVQNSRVINEWIRTGFAIDPFRALYPMQREVSYIPFRVRNNNVKYVSSRLDFFLISPTILDNICKVKYEDRIGADFDHKEVVISTGRGGSKSKVTVYDSTLEDPVAETMGLYAIYDVINNHLETTNEGLTRTLIQLDLLIKEWEIVNSLTERIGLTDELRERASNVEVNIGVVNRRLPVLTDLLGGRFSCNFRSLYEAIMMGLKNSLMILQDRKRREEARKREWLIESIQQMVRTFGEQSDQAESAGGICCGLMM